MGVPVQVHSDLKVDWATAYLAVLDIVLLIYGTIDENLYHLTAVGTL